MVNRNKARAPVVRRRATCHDANPTAISPDALSLRLRPVPGTRSPMSQCPTVECPPSPEITVVMEEE